MSNVIISPNMNLPVPAVGVDPGPDWATNVNGCMSGIDGHDHTPGKGVPISSASVNIDGDLPFNNYNATLIRSVRFNPQGTALNLNTDIGCLYEVGADLYYNDGSGNQIRMTQGGAVAGAAGTITGLPSGTASASYSGGIFTFQSATNTPAAVAIGPVTIGSQLANAKTVTIAPPNTLSANYSLTLPSGLPSTTSFLTIDSSGNMGLDAFTGSGAVVLANSPSFTAGASFAGVLTQSGALSTTPFLSVNTTTSPSGADYLFIQYQKSSVTIWDTGVDSSTGVTSGSDSAYFIYSNVIMAPVVIASTAGLVTIGASGGSQTHVVNGNLDVTGSVSGALHPTNTTGSGSTLVLSASPTLSGTLTVGSGGVAFTSGTIANVAQGTWTPTFSSISSNISSVTSVISGWDQLYIRIGNWVFCYGSFSLQVASGVGAGSLNWTFNMSLPIAPTNNFTTTIISQGIGTATSPSTLGSPSGMSNAVFPPNPVSGTKLFQIGGTALPFQNSFGATSSFVVTVNFVYLLT